MSGFDVAVVGGGVAGLAAATALAETGQRVIVLEARGELGGRATALRDRVTGELVDNGQHVLFGCYRETFAFLRRIGAEDSVFVQPSLEIPYLDKAGSRSVLRCPKWPPPLHLLGGVLRWKALPWRERIGALRVGSDLRFGFRQPDADETVADWLTRCGQQGRIREWLWEPLAVAALNQSSHEASAAPFIRVLQSMFSGGRTDASLVLPLCPLHEMYARPAQRFIEKHAGSVRLNALARVRIESARVAAVDVRGEPVPVRQVIAAVPWFSLASLVTGDLEPMAGIVSAASRMESKPIVTVNLWYDRVVMDGPFVGLPGRRMQWVFDKRRAFGETASHLSLVASGADQLMDHSSEWLIQTAAAEVAESIPGAREAVLRHGTVVREKRATFSVAAGQPPRPGVGTSVDGLFLAGDWIDTGLPGTIESAAIAGHRAAAAALRSTDRANAASGPAERSGARRLTSEPPERSEARERSGARGPRE